MAERMTMDVKEVAEQLHVSPPTIYRMMSCKDNPIPYILVGNRRIIPRDMLIEWIHRQAEMNRQAERTQKGAIDGVKD